MFKSVIDVPTLAHMLDDEALVVLDCRFDLAATSAGEDAYRVGHVPRARYLHLDRDLSGPPVTNRGRHPLPTPEVLVERFSRWGIDAMTQVVAYDDSGGAFAARAWWLLQYMSHAAVAVLDGGFSAWREAGAPVTSALTLPQPRIFTGAPRPQLIAGSDDAARASMLLDAREPRRYLGELETIDPRAGHIPGARNRYWRCNLDERGRFLDCATLRAEFAALLGPTDAADAVCYCGSGVTACHNLLAMAYAGLTPGRLYGGSWSEWSAEPDRPIALGAERHESRE